MDPAVLIKHNVGATRESRALDRGRLRDLASAQPPVLVEPHTRPAAKNVPEEPAAHAVYGLNLLVLCEPTFLQLAAGIEGSGKTVSLATTCVLIDTRIVVQEHESRLAVTGKVYPRSCGHSSLAKRCIAPGAARLQGSVVVEPRDPVLAGIALDLSGRIEMPSLKAGT